MLYFANVLFNYLLFMAALCSGGLALVKEGSRKFYTWWTLSVNREVLLIGFLLVILKLQCGPKNDEILHIFRPRPQTFCSHA